MAKVNIKHIIHKLNKKYLLLICVIILLSATIITIFARYVLNRENNFFTRSKEFYFNSDKLSDNTPSYRIENWSGVDDYVIIINMDSKGNNLLSTSYDINYNISYTCPGDVICNLSKSSGTIYSSTNMDYFTLRVTPNTLFNRGDMVSIGITAVASDPYVKTISANFTLVVGQENISFEIIDHPRDPYLELNITNTLSYYIVEQAFSTYSVGDRIVREAYMLLPDTDKNKCHSALIKLDFNPNVVLLDMTNNNYLNAINILNTVKNSYNYISSITFKIDAITSTKVRFYKINEALDYSYPNSGNTPPIITVTSL